MAIRNVEETIRVVKQHVNATIDAIHDGIKSAANSTYGREYLSENMHRQFTSDDNKTRNVALAVLLGSIAAVLCFEAVTAILFTAVKLTLAFGVIYTALTVYQRAVNSSAQLPLGTANS